MSATKRTGTHPSVTAKKATEPAPAGGPPGLAPAKPLKPRRGLFIILCVLFAVWVGLLVTLYFTSVYPHRHPATSQPTA